MNAPPPPDEPYPSGDDPGPRPPGDPLVARNFPDWLRRVGGALRRSGLRLLGLQGLLLGFQIALTLLAGVLLLLLGGLTVLSLGARNGVGPSAGLIITMVLLGLVAMAAFLVSAVWVSVASVWLIVLEATGHRIGLVEALRRARTRVGPMIGWGAVCLLVVVVAGVILGAIAWGIGTLLGGTLGPVAGVLGAFIFGGPMVWVTITLFATLTGVVVIERRDPGRCLELIRGRWWATFGRLLTLAVLSFVVIAVVFGVSLVAQHGASQGPGVMIPAVIAMYLLQLAAQLAVGVLTSVAALVTYAELRGHRDTATSTRLLEELTR